MGRALLWTAAVLQLAKLVCALALRQVSPDDCTGLGSPPDCRHAIAAAVNSCATEVYCTVELAPGRYRLACPSFSGPYGYIKTPGAVDLSNTTSLTFGATDPARPAHLYIDYQENGCPAIKAEHAINLTVSNLVLDTSRLPFTFGKVIARKDTPAGVNITFQMAEPARLEWNTQRYPWLLNAPQVDGMITSSWDQDNGTAHWFFESGAHPTYQNGSQIFMKHFFNMEAWGVYGWRVQHSFVVRHVHLLSAAGMGIRCDFCNGSFAMLESAVTPAVGRTMSSTADGVHLMHHTGHVLLQDSLINATGDDCFNVHGNFLVLSDIADNRRMAHYIDETGPGWIPGVGAELVGDNVAFFSRLTLQQIGPPNILIAASAGFGDNATLTFRDPIPDQVLRYDMIISLDRVPSLAAENMTFALGGRGMVISADSVHISNSTFRDLGFGHGANSILFLNGGCGAYEDYTEVCFSTLPSSFAFTDKFQMRMPQVFVNVFPSITFCVVPYSQGPFSRNVLIENNVFSKLSSTGGSRLGAAAAIQLAGCRPLGSCDKGPPGPLPPVIPPPGTFGPDITSMPNPYDIPANYAQFARAVRVQLPHEAHNDTFNMLWYYDTCSSHPSLTNVEMAVYADDEGRPAQLIGNISNSDGNCTSAAWQPIPLHPSITTQADTIWLVHFYDNGGWNTVQTEGEHYFTPWSGQRLPAMWTNTAWSKYAHSGIPLRVGVRDSTDYAPTYPPCSPGGSTRPIVIKHPDSRYEPGPGRIQEPGQPLQHTPESKVYENITIRNNTLISGQFLSCGTTSGIVLEGNDMGCYPGPNVLLFGSSGFNITEIERKNVCRDTSSNPMSTCDVEIDP